MAIEEMDLKIEKQEDENNCEIQNMEDEVLQQQ